jgi:hypothetical protein
MPGVVPVEILKAALFGGEPPPAGLPADERQAWEQLVAFGKHLGYALMGTRPQTLAGFADSRRFLLTCLPAACIDGRVSLTDERG